MQGNLWAAERESPASPGVAVTAPQCACLAVPKPAARLSNGPPGMLHREAGKEAGRRTMPFAVSHGFVGLLPA